MLTTRREAAKIDQGQASTTDVESSSAVQRKKALAGLSYDDQMAALRPPPIHQEPVQAQGEMSSAGVHQAAELGVSGSGGKLPHGDAIQASFGRHDVSGIQAHTDSAASAGSKAMNAEAFAQGNHVAFGGAPSLHTAAHEAAHVVQQRAGVSLKGGVGSVGDVYEQHADSVADAVVAGRSAEPLLDQMAGSGSSAAQAPIQMKPKAPPQEAPEVEPDVPEIDDDDPGMSPEFQEIEAEAEALGQDFAKENPALAIPEVAEAYVQLVAAEIQAEKEAAPKDTFWQKTKKLFRFRSKASKKHHQGLATDYIASPMQYGATATKVGAEATRVGAEATKFGAGLAGNSSLASSAGQVASTAGTISSVATGVGIGVGVLQAGHEGYIAARSGKQAYDLSKVSERATEGGDELVAAAANYAMRKKRKKAIRRTLGAMAAVTGVVATGFLLASNPVGWAIAAAGLGITIGVLGHKMYRKFFKKNKGKNRELFAKVLAGKVRDGNVYAIQAVEAMGLDATELAADHDYAVLILQRKLYSS